MKRDNSYYLGRLKDEHPTVYADLLAGKFKNASAAIRAAGLKRTPSPFDKLQRAWDEASSHERDAFKRFIGCATAPVATAASVAPVAVVQTARLATPTLPTKGMFLDAATVARFRKIMDRRGITTGKIMKEIGFDPLNASLGMALARGTQLHDPQLVDALEQWLKNQP